jgi:hypothetical protein
MAHFENRAFQVRLPGRRPEAIDRERLASLFAESRPRRE